MKVLVLAEKPSVGKEIARVLKCNIVRKGYLEASGYVVTWALGHLVALADPDDYDRKYSQWRMQDLPMLPLKMKLKVIRKTAHQFNNVRNLLMRKDISECIIATDAGREGELVARWILKLSGWKKDVRRLWISSQTDKAINEGFASLKPGIKYYNLYRSAVCRAEADWLVGLNITRALTCKYNAQFTAGRVQTPTLAMIADRETEIENFIPRDFFKVVACFGGYSGLWRDKNGNARIFEEDKAKELEKKIEGKYGVVIEITKKNRKELSPAAYDLTELQREANKRFGFSAKETLETLQRLYEQHKLVTYPRTDSRYITEDIVATIPERLKAIAFTPYRQHVEKIMQNKIEAGKHFVNSAKVTDHHAIIPTEKPISNIKLSGPEQRIHDLVVRRFIEVLSPAYIYEHTKVITESAGERFYSEGRKVIQPGWRAISNLLHTDVSGEDAVEDEDEDNEGLSNQKLDNIRKGDSNKITECRLLKGKTAPPSRYTEGSLLTMMENAGRLISDAFLKEAIRKSGIGTPATRAEIIEKLYYNGYIELHGRTIFITDKGKTLIELVPEKLKSPGLTAQWETRLKKIELGEEEPGIFMDDIRKNAEILVSSVRESTKTYTPKNVTDTLCPICGKKMLSFKGKKGKMLVCQDRNCGFRQADKKTQGDWFKKSKKERFINKTLIDKYTDQTSDTMSFGDLLKKAMKEKEKG